MTLPTDLRPGATGNLFLDALPAASSAFLIPKLDRVSLPRGTPIASAGKPIEYVVFPVASVISTVMTMRDGSGVEVSLVGRDGFYGLHVALGDERSADDAMVQLPDSGFRIRSADFREALRRDEQLTARVLRYAQCTLVAFAQLSACNRLHPVNERCARWLLMAHDRVDGDELALTHEYLATMLGVRRPAVSVAAAALDEAGLIAYHRGRIVVHNRRGLEAAACECYATVNGACRRILGYDARKREAARTTPLLRLEAD